MRLRYIGFEPPIGIELHGLHNNVVPLMPREANEHCDHCGKQVAALNTYFDGEQFLCPNCKRNRGVGRRRS